MSTQSYTLVVEVANACGLIPMDGQGSSSAWVELKFDGQCFRTAVKEKDLNPVWNERFFFPYESNPIKKKILNLEACVFHADYNSKSFLGRVQIYGDSIPPLSDDVIFHYYKLERRFFESCVSGDLCLRVYTNDLSVRPQPPPTIASIISFFLEQLFKQEDPSPRPCGMPLVQEEDWSQRLRGIPFVQEEDRSPRLRDVPLVQEEDQNPRPRGPLVQEEDGSPRPRDMLLVEEGGQSPRLCAIPLVQKEGRCPRPIDIPLVHLKEITDNFSDERILGHGGFGVVYKGVLRNGEMIAVKKIRSSLMSGSQKKFENEVNHLMMLNHPNIVRLVGYCYETRNVCLEHNGKNVLTEITERLLCLEYLPKGSLDKYISDESSGLDWSTRYSIIEGIFYGLCHLHEKLDNPIIHLDLKPANILLDDGMVPKLTDFGLSRLLDQQRTICTSSRDGTFGYMAPEFLHGGTITPKSDIFSFGVIIIEVVTGHRDYPYVTCSDGFIELTVEKWRNVLQRSSGNGSLERDCEQIKRCIQVGLICVNPDRTKRPALAEIINMLQGSENIDCDISNNSA